MESSQECQAYKYRLQKINEIQAILTDEVEKRTILSKKYHKWVKILGGVDDVLVGSTMVIEVISVALLVTAVSSPAIIPVNIKNCSLSTVLTATDRKQQKSLKGDITHHHIA